MSVLQSGGSNYISGSWVVGHGRRPLPQAETGGPLIEQIQAERQHDQVHGLLDHVSCVLLCARTRANEHGQVDVFLDVNGRVWFVLCGHLNSCAFSGLDWQPTAISDVVLGFVPNW